MDEIEMTIERYRNLFKAAKITHKQFETDSSEGGLTIAIVSGPMVINPEVEKLDHPVLFVQTVEQAEVLNDNYASILLGLPEEY